MKKRRKEKKKGRPRVSREDIRKATAQKGGGGSPALQAPEGFRLWEPTSKGKYRINVLPYEVSDKNHPDDGVKKGVLWFMRPYSVHKDVGPNRKNIICPRSVGKRCWGCEQRDEIWKEKPTGEKEKKKQQERAKVYKTQPHTVMNIVGQEDKEAVDLFNISFGKFWDQGEQQAHFGLRKKIHEGDDDIVGFYHCEGGKTIIAVFDEAEFNNNTFYKAVEIRFKDREDMDEDEILEKVCDLDELIKSQTPSYEEVRALFEGADEDDEDEKPKKKGKKKDEDEDDEDDSDDEDDGEDDGEDDDDEDEEEEESDEEDDDDDDEDEDEDDDDEEEDEDEKPRKKRKR